MTYSRRDLRQICELIELDIKRYGKSQQNTEGVWRPITTHVPKDDIIKILRKHLYIRPTEEELRDAIKLIRESQE